MKVEGLVAHATAAVTLLSIVTTGVRAEEDCSPAAIGLTDDSGSAERLYYTGTCHFRNEDYLSAAESWAELASLETVGPADFDLQVDVLNNLGYLLFFGQGIDAEPERAVEYWTRAVSLGQIEAEYHLCHALGDEAQPTHDAPRARMHCEKAFLIYRAIDDPSPNAQQMLQTISDYRARLR
jgi:TPR repeat protein